MEVTSQDCTKINNEVLRLMLNLSLLDNKAGALSWSEGTSVKQAMRLSANMIVRVLQRVWKQDDKVSHPGHLSLMMANSVTSDQGDGGGIFTGAECPDVASQQDGRGGN